MRVFVDSADQKQIVHWLEQGVVDGVTTNPSIMFKDGVTDLEEGARRLAALLGERPLSVEVTSNDREIMLEHARSQRGRAILSLRYLSSMSSENPASA